MEKVSIDEVATVPAGIEAPASSAAPPYRAGMPPAVSASAPGFIFVGRP